MNRYAWITPNGTFYTLHEAERANHVSASVIQKICSGGYTSLFPVNRKQWKRRKITAAHARRMEEKRK